MAGNPIPGRMRSLLGDYYRDLIAFAPSATVAREWGDRYRSEWSRALIAADLDVRHFTHEDLPQIRQTLIDLHAEAQGADRDDEFKKKSSLVRGSLGRQPGFRLCDRLRRCGAGGLRVRSPGDSRASGGARTSTLPRTRARRSRTPSWPSPQSGATSSRTTLTDGGVSSRSARLRAPPFPTSRRSTRSTRRSSRPLSVQGRGELRREPARALRTGRVRRKPRRQAQQRQPRYRHPMVMISERPASEDDRAVPGDWDGDLIKGRENGSAIGTPVERSPRYLLLVHLPHGRATEPVRDRSGEHRQDPPRPPEALPDLGAGQRNRLSPRVQRPPDVPVYFYDPASPFQCRSNENVNGPLRQYFPKGTDLSVHSPEHLAAVAAELDHDVDVAELPATGSARRGGHPGSPSSPPGRSRSPRPASRRSPGAGSRCRR